MKAAKFIKQSEAIRARYNAEIEALAVEAREAILPYFTKHDLTYIAGNGTWFIHKRGSDRHVEDDALPKWIRELLWIEFDHGHYLGFWIADIGR